MNGVDPVHRIKQEPCGKTPCAPVLKGCVIIMTHTGLNEGFMYLCGCDISKLLRAQLLDIKVGSFDCSFLCVIGLIVRAEPSLVHTMLVYRQCNSPSSCLKVSR